MQTTHKIPGDSATRYAKYLTSTATRGDYYTRDGESDQPVPSRWHGSPDLLRSLGLDPRRSRSAQRPARGDAGVLTAHRRAAAPRRLQRHPGRRGRADVRAAEVGLGAVGCLRALPPRPDRGRPSPRGGERPGANRARGRPGAAQGAAGSSASSAPRASRPPSSSTPPAASPKTRRPAGSPTPSCTPTSSSSPRSGSTASSPQSNRASSTAPPARAAAGTGPSSPPTCESWALPIERRTGRGGRYFEIRGVPEGLASGWSSRSEDVDRAARIFRQRYGREPRAEELGSLTIATRGSKSAADRLDVNEAWRAVGEEHGLSAERAEQLFNERSISNQESASTFTPSCSKR